MLDQQGNMLVSGTFNQEVSVSSGSLQKRTNASNQSTFLGVFNTNTEQAKDDGIIYLKNFFSANHAYASQGMTMFEQGDQLEVYIPIDHDRDLKGLEDDALSSNASNTYNTFIGKYRFPSIPTVISGTYDANTPSDPFYVYRIFGRNLDKGVSGRLLDEDDNITIIEDFFSEGDEDLGFSVPTSIVAGKSYRVILDKGIYKNFFSFNTLIKVQPAVFELPEASKEKRCEETLEISGRYFGSVTSGVEVFLDLDGVATPTELLAVAPEKLQVKVPPLYPDTYEIRVRVNGEESKGDMVTVLPHISQIVPAAAEPGETIVAEGCAFIVDASTPLPTVSLQKVGDAPVSINPTVTIAEPTQLNVPLPSDLPPGEYTLSVKVNEKEATGVTKFVVVPPGDDPIIQSISATSSKPGDELTIQGKHITAAAGEKIFVRLEGRDPIEATANAEGTVITFTLPDDIPASDYSLTVIVGEQEAIGTLTLQVLSEAEPSPLATPFAEPSSRTTTDFTLSWEAIARANRYVVEVATNSTFEEASIVFSDTIAELTQPITSLTTGQTYHYRVKAINEVEESGVNEQAITMFAISSDANNANTFETEVTLAAEVAGATDGSQVKLILEGLSSLGRKVLDASPSENSRFNVLLPAAELDDPIGVEYRFRVRSEEDSLQTEQRRVYRQYSQVPVALPDKETLDQKDYRLVALPFQGQAVTAGLQGVTTFNKDSIRLLRYDPDAAQDGDNTDYQEYKESGFNNFEPGRGYWLLKRQGLNLEVQGTAAEIDEDYNFTLQLQEGWNLVGNPFPFALDVASLGDGTKRFHRANGYEEASGNVQPYEGVLVSSDRPQTLTISARTEGGSRNAAASAGISSYHDHPLDSDRWYVGLEVSNGYLTNSLIGVGMHRQAQDALDRFDVSPMPRFKRYVEAQFANAEVPYALERDIVAPAAQHTWSFDLVADVASEVIDIHWDPTHWGHNDRQLLLLDTEAQRLIDMRAVTQYTFRATQSRRAFKLFYGSEDDLNDRVLPHQVQVGAAYPNPATQQVFLPISIPKEQAETEVVVQLTDLAGRQVQHLQQRLNTGFHTISWDRHDDRRQPLPAGLYFYRVTVGDEQFAGKLMYQEER